MSIDEVIEQAIQGHASTRDAIRWAIEQAKKQEPVIPAGVINAIRNVGLTLIKTQQGYVLQRIEGIKAQTAAPVHASDMSEKHVHISDKDRHEFECPRCGHYCRDGLERLCRIMGTFDLATGHADTIDEALDALELELRDVLGHLRARRPTADNRCY